MLAAQSVTKHIPCRGLAESLDPCDDRDVRPSGDQPDQLVSVGDGDTVMPAPAQDRSGNRVELRLAPGSDVLLHRAPRPVGKRFLEHAQRVLVDLCALSTSDGEDLVLAASIALVVANGAEGRVRPARLSRLAYSDLVAAMAS